VLGVAAIAVGIIVVATPVVMWAIPYARPVRMLVAFTLLLPMGIALGIPMPTGMRMLAARAPQMVAWAWGINGALSVLGATLAIFVAMNWGFQVTLLAAAATYLLGLFALLAATRFTRPTRPTRPTGLPSRSSLIGERRLAPKTHSYSTS
jgi:hypothetical protein